jgi:MFS family permease
MNQKSTARVWPHTLRALKYPHFRLFMTGQLVSLIGTAVQGVAQSWLVYRLTGSPKMLGIVAFASLIPALMLGPFGGVVADRFDRRRVVIGAVLASATSALLLAMLTLTNMIQVWHVLLLGVVNGSANAFEIPARQSMVSELVDRSDLPNAIALNSSAFNLSRIVGPAIGGMLLGLIGEGWCFLGNAITYIPVLCSLLLIPFVMRARPIHTTPALTAIAEGFNYFRKSPALLATGTAVMIMGLAGNPYLTLMPVFADKVLHGGPHTLGYLMGAVGIGALIGALQLAARAHPTGLSRWIEFGMLGIGGGLLVFAWSPWLLLSMPVLVVTGLSGVLGTTSANTLIQSLAPEHLRGRVVSIYIMILMGSSPIGALLSGALAEQIGVSAMTSVNALLCITGGIWYGRRMAVMRADHAANRNAEPNSTNSE